MVRNVTVNGIDYNGVESVRLPLAGGGNAVFVDTSDANAVAGDLARGKTMYVNGTKVVGTYFSVTEVPISYSGTMANETAAINGVGYRLLTLTSSGTLTLDEPLLADIWLCGGGNGGSSDGGGSGGYFASISAQTIESLTVIVGAGGIGSNRNTGTGGGTTTISGDVTLSSQTGTKGSGGGESYGGLQGRGGGVSTVPFGDSTKFGYPCAGGGGKGYSRTPICRGGQGGSDGSDGGRATTGGGSGGAGGVTGGGAGGSSGNGNISGSPATYYGSGGGAECNGYQGVVFIRIPLVQ